MGTSFAAIQVPDLSVIVVCNLYVILAESADVKGPLPVRTEACAGAYGAALQLFEMGRAFAHFNDSRNV